VRALPYCGRLAIKPFDGLRTGVGSKGRKASAPNQTESHVEQVATLYLRTAQVHCTCVQRKCTVLAYSASALYLRTAQVWITKVKVYMYVPSCGTSRV
jgi:hypothetical protein